MKLRLLFFIVIITAALTSCNDSGTNKYEKIEAANTLANNGVVYEESRESLPLTIDDTIAKREMRFFSDAATKDLFQLKIDPGMVKHSKARFEIINSTGNVIYIQTFDAFYFVRYIYEPDTIPTSGGQAEYDAFLQQYWKALRPQQYATYFKRSVDSFFTYMYPLVNIKTKTLEAWRDGIEDTNFWEEVFQDTSITLLDVPCFDCDEGGYVIGYSRRQHKAVTLLGHD